MDIDLSKLQETVEDRGAWRATVRGVTKSQTQLSDSTTKSKVAGRGDVFLHPTICSHLVSYTLFISLANLNISWYSVSGLNILRPQDQLNTERKFSVWSWLFSQRKTRPLTARPVSSRLLSSRCFTFDPQGIQRNKDRNLPSLFFYEVVPEDMDPDCLLHIQPCSLGQVTQYICSVFSPIKWNRKQCPPYKQIRLILTKHLAKCLAQRKYSKRVISRSVLSDSLRAHGL